MTDRLTDAQREAWRRAIAATRDRAMAREAGLVKDFDDIVASSDEAVRDDEHDPEGATIAFERAQVAALIADAQAQLVALRRAAERSDAPRGDCCAQCGAPIGIDRMLSRPAATNCVRCAENSPRLATD